MNLLHRLTDGVPPRALWSLALLLAALLVAPALLGKYGLSVLILILYFAYVGQAWNIMMGFAGQLSLTSAPGSGASPIAPPGRGTRCGCGRAARPCATGCGRSIGCRPCAW